MPSKLLPRVLWRVLPCTIAALLGIWVFASYVVTDTVSAELERALSREAEKAAEATGTKLTSAILALEGLAQNDLIVNGLVDVEGRANYLPTFFQSFHVPGTVGGRVALTDYRGRVIASNGKGGDYTDAPWLKRALAGERVTEFGSFGMVSVIPVIWQGHPEGLIVMEQDPIDLQQMLKVISFAHAVEIWINDSARFHLFSGSSGTDHHTKPRDSAGWVTAEVKVPEFPNLRIVVKQRTEDAFATSKRLDRLMLIAIVMSILAITGGIIATAVFATKPLNRFVETLQKISHAENLGHRIAPFGSAEFHVLSSSLNHMLENLEKTTTSRDYFNTVLNSLSEILLITDFSGRIGMANRAASEITHWSVEELVGLNIDTILRVDSAPQYISRPGADKSVKATPSYEGFLAVKDGKEISVQVSSARMAQRGDMPARKIYVLSDITERKQAEQQLSDLARLDTLTGLANRSLFYQRLHEALAQAQRTGRMVALLLLDLDRFKEINDTLGHPAGDALLREVAVRLCETMRETDTVARLGGDEFAIIATNLESLDGIGPIANKLIEAIAPPFHLDGQEVRTSTSIGVSVCPPEEANPDVMLTHADFALYQAKAEGRGNWQFFDEDMNGQRKARKALEADLERAIANDQFTLFYQPKVHAVTGELTGVEALIRWHHPERGMVSPMEFIPIAESVGRIVELGEWVMRTACAQHVAWREAGLPAIPISVNLSAVQFKNDGLAETIHAITSEFGVDPTYLELEITESTIIHNLDAVARQFEALHALGYKVLIDDFGTGYSSLAYLRRFPIDALKIDRSFVANMTENPDDASITGAIVSLARSLGIDVVAEGVETPEQLALLRRQGCTEVQGYLFKPPVPADDFVEWLQARSRPWDELVIEESDFAAS